MGLHFSQPMPDLSMPPVFTDDGFMCEFGLFLMDDEILLILKSTF